MPEKDSSIYDFLRSISPYCVVFLLSLWGGLVDYMNQLRKGKKFNKVLLVINLVTALFAGYMVYYICEAADIAAGWHGPLSGIAGYMGPRALASLEILFKSKLSIIATPTDSHGCSGCNKKEENDDDTEDNTW